MGFLSSLALSLSLYLSIYLFLSWSLSFSLSLSLGDLLSLYMCLGLRYLFVFVFGVCSRALKLCFVFSVCVFVAVAV